MSGITQRLSAKDAAAHRLSPRAIHPLDAPPEQKLFHPALGRMSLTPRVKLALFVVQGYLGIMTLLVGWKLVTGS